MGNQNSFSVERNSEDKLLRRNMRSAFPHLSTVVGQPAPNPNLLGGGEEQRQARSRSLEPRSTQEIKDIEHSKSARYGRHKKKHSAFAGAGIPPTQLWNPEEQRLELLRMQLQNPLHGGSRDSIGGGNGKRMSKLSIGQLKDEEFRRQLRTIVLMNKRRESLDVMDNNVTEQEQVHRSITGLSSHQTQILQKIWSRATENDVMDCTRNIFTHLLRSNSRIYQFFNLTDMTDKEILESAIFARQSANFAMVFDYVITNMSDLERVCFALQCLGERHSRLPYPVDNSLWMLFKRVFEDNPPKIVFQNAEGHAVWKAMIGFIIQQMRIGYDRVAPDDDDTPHLKVGQSLDREYQRPKSAQSKRENSSLDHGVQRELSRLQKFTHSQQGGASSLSRSRQASQDTHQIFTSTMSCV